MDEFLKFQQEIAELESGEAGADGDAAAGAAAPAAVAAAAPAAAPAVVATPSTAVRAAPPMSNPVIPPPPPGTARAAGATAAAPPPPPPPHAVGHAIHMHVSAAAAATAPAATPQQAPKPHAANQVVSATSAAAPSIAAARAAAAAPTQSGKEVAATLAPDEWPANDYKIFCGNLDKLVGDEVLSKAFSSYPSFVKAKICRDPKTNRHKVSRPACAVVRSPCCGDASDSHVAHSVAFGAQPRRAARATALRAS